MKQQLHLFLEVLSRAHQEVEHVAYALLIEAEQVPVQGGRYPLESSPMLSLTARVDGANPRIDAHVLQSST